MPAVGHIGRIGATKRTQTLASGVIVRQDFRDAVRFVFFETGDEDWVYGSHGGTAFVVTYRGKCYALTANHVRGDFSWSQLVITDKKVGSKRAPLRGVYFPSSPIEEATGTDLLDIAVIEFDDLVNTAFFDDTTYILDSNTAGSSVKGHSLVVAGNLKDQTNLVEQIAPVYALLQFTDTGMSGSDKTLRHATAQYTEQKFQSLEGLSGAPVYDQTENRLCGLIVRGGPIGKFWRVHFVDVFDIMKLLDAVHSGRLETYYQKTIVQQV